MVHILGVQLPDAQVARFALTAFYGIGHKTAHRLCARLQIHNKCKIKNLSPTQVTALAAFLSSPSTAPPLPRAPLASPSFIPPSSHIPLAQIQAALTQKSSPDRAKNRGTTGADPLKNLKIESELRRVVRENIAHQRMIGSYVGRRHAMHLPVRGQNTQTNAKTARRLNKVERWG